MAFGRTFCETLAITYVVILTLSPLCVIPSYVRTVKDIQQNINILKQKPGYRDDFPNTHTQLSSDEGKLRTDNKCNNLGCVGEVTITTPVVLERGFSRTFTAVPSEPHLQAIAGRIWIPEMTTRASLGFQYFAPVGDICHLFGVDDSKAANTIGTAPDEAFAQSCTDSARLIDPTAKVGSSPVTYAYQNWVVNDLDVKYSCGHWTANSMTAKQGAIPFIKDPDGAGVYSIHEEPTIIGSLCIELAGITTCTDIKSDTLTGIKVELNGNIVDARFSEVIKPTRLPTGFLALRYLSGLNGTMEPTEVRYGSSLGRDTPPLKGSIGEFRTNCRPIVGDMSCGLQTYDLKATFSQAIVPAGSDTSTTLSMRSLNDANPRFLSLARIYLLKRNSIDLFDVVTPRFGLIAGIIAAIAAAAVVAAATTAGVAAGAADNQCTVKRDAIVPDSRFDTLFNNLVTMDNKFGRQEIVMPETLRTTSNGIGAQLDLDFLSYEKLPATLSITANGLQLAYVEDMGRVISFVIPRCTMYSYAVGSFCRAVISYEGQPGQLGITCTPYVCMRTYLNLVTGDSTFDIAMQSPGVSRATPQICYASTDGNICVSPEETEFKDQTGGDYGNIGETDGEQDSGYSGSFWDVLTRYAGTAALFFCLILIGIGLIIVDGFIIAHFAKATAAYMGVMKMDSVATFVKFEGQSLDFTSYLVLLLISVLILRSRNRLLQLAPILMCLLKGIILANAVVAPSIKNFFNFTPVSSTRFALDGKTDYLLEDKPGRIMFSNRTLCLRSPSLYLCGNDMIYNKSSQYYLRTIRDTDLQVFQKGKIVALKRAPTTRAVPLCNVNGVLEPFCNYTETVVIEGSTVANTLNMGHLASYRGTFLEACNKLMSYAYDCLAVNIYKRGLTDPGGTRHVFQAFPDPDKVLHTQCYLCAPSWDVRGMQFQITSGDVGIAFYAAFHQETNAGSCNYCKADVSKAQVYVKAHGLANVTLQPTNTSIQNDNRTWYVFYYGNGIRHLVHFSMPQYYFTPLIVLPPLEVETSLFLGKMLPSGTVYVPVYIEIITLVPTTPAMKQDLIDLIEEAVTFTGDIQWLIPNTGIVQGIRTIRFYLQVFCNDYCSVQYTSTADGIIQATTMMLPSNSRATDFRQGRISATAADCSNGFSYIYIQGVPFAVKPGIGNLELTCGLVNSSAEWLKLFCYGKNYHGYVEVCDVTQATAKVRGGEAYGDDAQYTVQDDRYTIMVAPVGTNGLPLDSKIVNFDSRSVVDSDFVIYSYSDKEGYLYAAAAGEEIRPINGTGKTLNVYTSLAQPDLYNVSPQKKNCDGFTNSVDCLVDKYPEVIALPAIVIVAAIVLVIFLVGRCIVDYKARKAGILAGRIPFQHIAGKVMRAAIAPGKKAYRYVTNKIDAKGQKKKDEADGVYDVIIEPDKPKPPKKTVGQQLSGLKSRAKKSVIDAMHFK